MVGAYRCCHGDATKKKERNGERERGRKRGVVVFTIAPTISMQCHATAFEAFRAGQHPDLQPKSGGFVFHELPYLCILPFIRDDTFVNGYLTL
jgi:hypothetical protein